MEAEQFRTFLIDRFYKRGDKPRFSNILEFYQLNERTYQRIHVDMKRSCSLASYYINNPRHLPKLQILFENYFMTVFLQLSQQAQGLYYQSLSDIFEVIFVAFVNFPYVAEMRNFFYYADGEYTPFYGDPQQFYFGYDLMVNIGSSVILEMYSASGFANKHFERYIEAICGVLHRQDPQLGRYFSDPQSPYYSMLVKLALSNGLHYCTRPSIAFPLAKFTLYNLRKPGATAVFNALLLSCCCRTYAPDLLDFDRHFTGRLASSGVTGAANPLEQLYGVLTNAFADVLGLDANAKAITEMTAKAAKVSATSELNKALSIGGGIAAGLIGGGLALLGGLLAASQ